MPDFSFFASSNSFWDCTKPRSKSEADVYKRQVRNNADVQAFITSYGQAISGLPADLRSRLVEHPEQVDALGQETAIGKELDAMIAGTPLVDPYDAYQKLDDAWNGISIDLEVLGSEGFDVVRACLLYTSRCV